MTIKKIKTATKIASVSPMKLGLDKYENNIPKVWNVVSFLYVF